MTGRILAGLFLCSPFFVEETILVPLASVAPTFT